ncbi:uncharacterized protein LOC133374479 [Rhineura floridana]|uniref:uncharacterized protein LOC133374479 n=1 Tax=Rhineura floridana TaxID=261503 RepID=UPI002AC84A51|nr:uncharacterized protein LOC133374479 [Rhineura floridana]
MQFHYQKPKRKAQRCCYCCIEALSRFLLLMLVATVIALLRYFLEFSGVPLAHVEDKKELLTNSISTQTPPDGLAFLRIHPPTSAAKEAISQQPATPLELVSPQTSSRRKMDSLLLTAKKPNLWASLQRSGTRQQRLASATKQRSPQQLTLATELLPQLITATKLESPHQLTSDVSSVLPQHLPSVTEMTPGRPQTAAVEWTSPSWLKVTTKQKFPAHPAANAQPTSQHLTTTRSLASPPWLASTTKRRSPQFCSARPSSPPQLTQPTNLPSSWWSTTAMKGPSSSKPTSSMKSFFLSQLMIAMNRTSPQQQTTVVSSPENLTAASPWQITWLPNVTYPQQPFLVQDISNPTGQNDTTQYFKGSFLLLNEVYHSSYSDPISASFGSEARKLENIVSVISECPLHVLNMKCNLCNHSKHGNVLAGHSNCECEISNLKLEKRVAVISSASSLSCHMRQSKRDVIVLFFPIIGRWWQEEGRLISNAFAKSALRLLYRGSSVLALGAGPNVRVDFILRFHSSACALTVSPNSVAQEMIHGFQETPNKAGVLVNTDSIQVEDYNGLCLLKLSWLSSISGVSNSGGTQEDQNTNWDGCLLNEQGRWPWAAILLKSRGPVCGGSLIADNWVLSARSCVASGDFSLYSVKLGSSKHASSDELYPVAEIVPLPSSAQEDVALIQLAKSTPITSSVHPICLHDASHVAPSGTGCWALASMENVAPLDVRQWTVTSQASCFPFSSSTSTCAQASDLKKKPQLTTGGPLVCPGEKGHLYLEGIVPSSAGSHSKPEGESKQQSATFVRIAPLVPWITSQLLP